MQLTVTNRSTIDPAAIGYRRKSMTHAPSVILIVAILLYGALLFRPNGQLAAKPITEDAYYALTVARNVAHSDGITIDGEHSTNGFQPLFTAYEVGLYSIFRNDFLVLRALLFTQIVILVATALILGRIVADSLDEERTRRGAVPVTMALYLTATTTTLNTLNGLETGLVLLLLCIFWRRHQLYGHTRPKDVALQGVLFGLCILARIDTVFLAFPLFALTFVEARRLRTAILRTSVIVGLGALLSSPWWIYGIMEFGSPVPISGQATGGGFGITGLQLHSTFLHLSANLIPWLYASRFDILLLAVLRYAIFAAATIFLVWHTRHQRFASRVNTSVSDKTVRSRRFAAVLVGCCILLVCYYTFGSWTSGFYIRYFSPISLIGVWVIAQALLLVKPRRFAIPVWATAGTFAAIGLVGSAMLALPNGPTGMRTNAALTQQMPLVERHVPPDAWVAAGQTGTLGFWRPRVVNLDGKVNVEMLRARQEGRLVEEIDRLGIDWVCDEPLYLRILDLEFRPPEWRVAGREGTFVCYKRVSPSASEIESQ